jgi:outer membrane protein OmpA-like peptidoglycan-associated protein
MSSRTLIPLTLCLAAVVTASSAHAQGAIEFGGFGSYTRFDKTLTLKDQPAAGARLSIISGAGFATSILELEGAYATQGVGPLTLRYIPARARLMYSLPLGSNAAFLIGGGGVRNDFNDGTGSGSVIEYGWTSLAGFQLRLGFTSLRIDGVLDYISNPANESDVLTENVNYGVAAGLQIPLYTDRRMPKPRAIAEPPKPTMEPAAPAPAPAPASDADKDGVADDVDACSNTPAGVNVDREGCAVYRDTDNDGVVDPKDACPATLANAAIDGRGCAIGDADGDGVTNTADRCPNTVAGERVDAMGCAIVIPKPAVETDSDNDGVLDSRDRCPATPAGTSADAYGCPILFKNPAERSVTLRGVNFASGRDELTPASFAVLDDVARQLVEAPTVRVEVVGHTDATGGRTRNIKLSLARAEAVRAYLIMQGVPAERLVARGFGPDKPIANNGTSGGRAANRRVELRRID